MYSISKNILNIDGREITLETTIDKVLEYNNLIILIGVGTANNATSATIKNENLA